MATIDWATITDVSNITGKTATLAQLQQAQFIIMIFTDISPDSSFQSSGVATGLISTKNLRYLKFAVAYQTAWMLDHPDVFTNIDATNVSEDGLSFTQAHENAAILAPLARRSIKRLTWMRPNRSIRIGKKLDPAFPYIYGSRDSATADDSRDWSPT